MATQPTGSVARSAAYGVLDRPLTNRESWATFWTLFFFCTVTMYNMLRVTPVLTEIGAAYGMALSGSGLIISTFAFAGVFFAFPGAWIMHRFGIKSMLLLAGVASVVGTLLGLVSTSVWLLLVSRAVEGIGCGIASVIVPNVVPRLFPLEKMGLVMGIWSLWVTPGNVIAFLTTAPLYEAFGIKSAWIVALILEVVTTAALVLFCKLPNSVLSESDSPASGVRVYKHVHFKSAMFVGISMLCWGMVYGALNAFFPTFLNEVHGTSLVLASMVPLLVTIVTAPFGILFGILAGRWKARKWFLFAGYVLVTVLYITVGFRANASMASIWVFSVLFGVAAGAIPMATYALIPILAEDPKKADYGTATLTFAMMLGNILNGLCGAVITAFGFWGYSLVIVIPAGLIGALIALFIVSDKRAIAEQEADS